MHLRLAQATDLPAMAEVGARAMLDDELFAYLCPRRREFYADYQQSFLQRLRSKWLTPAYLMVVAVADPSPRAPILGYGVWEQINTNLHGLSPSVTTRWNLIQQRLWLWCDHGHAWAFPDRSVDPRHLETYNATATDCFPFAEHPQLLLLSSLAVHPAHQRQGIGRSLVEWGLEHAGHNVIPVGLEASVKGTTLYERLGFHTVAEAVLGPGIPIRGMLWRPPIVTAG